VTDRWCVNSSEGTRERWRERRERERERDGERERERERGSVKISQVTNFTWTRTGSPGKRLRASIDAGILSGKTR